MVKYIVKDVSRSLDDKTFNEKELIEYANQAHFVLNGEVPKAKDIENAISILQTDLFDIEEIKDSNDMTTEVISTTLRDTKDTPVTIMLKHVLYITSVDTMENTSEVHLTNGQTLLIHENYNDIEDVISTI